MILHGILGDFSCFNVEVILPHECDKTLAHIFSQFISILSNYL
nr:MAG TPA: hypothetical protein [Caudoviricetes sp.]